MPRLRRADCSRPGIRRRRAGKGFTYVDALGAPVRDPDVLARIRALVIPPAWTDVWICPDPLGHIQAVGFDAKGRKQYRYHDAWRLRRDREKFEHMLSFARALPRLRRVTGRHLAGEGLTKERVLACAVRLLDLGFFRIGTEGYAEENQTFGLATIRRRHVRVEGDEVTFDYTSKSGKRRIQSVADRAVVAVVAELKARDGGGHELLAYRSADTGEWCDVKSADINAYIKQVTGGDFSAKDFRTWAATVLAAAGLANGASDVRSATARKRAIAQVMKGVAEYLGNTPAVARSSYVDPRVVDRFLDGATIEATAVSPRARRSIEAAVLELLADDEPAAEAA